MRLKSVTGETGGGKRDKSESKHPQDRDEPEIVGKMSQVLHHWSYKDFRELPRISRGFCQIQAMKNEKYVFAACRYTPLCRFSSHKILISHLLR